MNTYYIHLIYHNICGGLCHFLYRHLLKTWFWKKALSCLSKPKLFLYFIIVNQKQSGATLIFHSCLIFNQYCKSCVPEELFSKSNMLQKFWKIRYKNLTFLSKPHHIWSISKLVKIWGKNLLTFSFFPKNWILYHILNDQQWFSLSGYSNEWLTLSYGKISRKDHLWNFVFILGYEI